MSECSFRVEHYRKTLQAYRDAGYKLIDFSCYFSLLGKDELPEKFVVLRHDLDFSGGNLCSILWGESSTLFIRLHSPSYNALSPDKLRALWWYSCSYGTTLGIHIEPDMVSLIERWNSTYGYRHVTHPEKSTRSVVPVKWLSSCIDMLNRVLPHKLCAASLHCIAKGATDTQWIVDVCKDWGLPLVGPDMPGLKYLSDSNGRWREGCFCQWIDKEPRLHVLTHPIWWFSQSPQENY